MKKIIANAPKTLQTMDNIATILLQDGIISMFYRVHCHLNQKGTNMKKLKVGRMKKIITTIGITIMVFTYTSYSQVDTVWTARYLDLNNQHESAYAMEVDGAGNVYVTGVARSNNDYTLTVKYNSAGIVQWFKNYGDTFSSSIDMIPIGMDLDMEGNIYILGTKHYAGDSMVVIKYDTSGILLWDKKTNLTGSGAEARDIVVDSGGNVYVTACARLGSPAYDDILTQKYNSDGILQWSHFYDGNDDEEPFAIAVDLAGNCFVTGNGDAVTGKSDFITLKYNTTGVLQWAKLFDSNNSYDKAYDIDVDLLGNCVITGILGGPSPNYADFGTVMYSPTGVELWSKIYNGPMSNDDEAFSVSFDNNGNVIVSGTSFGTDTTNDIAVIKYSQTGIQLWEQRYSWGNHTNDFASNMIIDNYGSIFISGFTAGSSTDYLTTKYNWDGVLLWATKYNGIGNSQDKVFDMTLDNSGNVYITGESVGTGALYLDFLTIKYQDNLTGVQHISSQILENYSLSQNYPNPFNPATTIKYSIPKSSLVTLKVYDVLGNEVATLVNEEKYTGSYEASLNASRLSSGVYFYKLLTGSFSETKKLILLK